MPTYPYGLTSYLPSNFQPYSPNVYCAGTDYQDGPIMRHN